MRCRLFCAAMAAGAIASVAVYGQSSVTVSGGEARGQQGSSSYTVGQTVYASHITTKGSVLEGVQQPYTIRALAGGETSDVNLFIAAYPNPASTTLALRVQTTTLQGYSCELVDVTGKVVHMQNVDAELTSIPIEEKAQGAYVLRVLQNGVQVKSFQIIKKN